MNILEIATHTSRKLFDDVKEDDNITFSEDETKYLEAFATAIIETYKAWLVPVAYMWQHEETGNIGFTDQWQIDNKFKENNPRLNIIAPLYALPSGETK